MQNIEFIKRKARFHDDVEGQTLQRKFRRLEPVFVPIFDGMGAIDPSMKQWLDGNFDGATEGLGNGKRFYCKQLLDI